MKASKRSFKCYCARSLWFHLVWFSERQFGAPHDDLFLFFFPLLPSALPLLFVDSLFSPLCVILLPFPFYNHHVLLRRLQRWWCWVRQLWWPRCVLVCLVWLLLSFALSRSFCFVFVLLPLPPFVGICCEDTFFSTWCFPSFFQPALPMVVALEVLHFPFLPPHLSPLPFCSCDWRYHLFAFLVSPLHFIDISFFSFFFQAALVVIRELVFVLLLSAWDEAAEGRNGGEGEDRRPSWHWWMGAAEETSLHADCSLSGFPLAHSHVWEEDVEPHVCSFPSFVPSVLSESNISCWSLIVFSFRILRRLSWRQHWLCRCLPRFLSFCAILLVIGGVVSSFGFWLSCGSFVVLSLFCLSLVVPFSFFLFLFLFLFASLSFLLQAMAASQAPVFLFDLFVWDLFFALGRASCLFCFPLPASMMRVCPVLFKGQGTTSLRSMFS